MRRVLSRLGIRYERPSKVMWLVLGVSLIIRVWGLGYGVPLLYSVMDENGHYIGALYVLANKTLVSPFFHTIVGAYLTALVLGVTIMALLWLKVFPSVNVLKRYLVLNPGFLLPVARLMSVGFGLLNIYLFYDLAYQITGNKKIAHVAAGLLGFCLLHVQLSSFARPWTLSLIWMLLVLKLALGKGGNKKQIWRRNLVVGVLVGIGWGTHQSGIINFIVMFYMIAKDVLGRKYGVRKLVNQWLLPIAAVGMLILSYQLVRSPNSYFDYPEYINDLLVWPPRLIDFWRYVEANTRFFIKILLFHEPVLTATGVMGMVWFGKEKRYRDLYWLTVVTAVVSFMTFYQTSRSMLPLFLELALFGAVAVVKLVKMFRVVLVKAMWWGLVFGINLVLVARYDWLLVQKPTFVEANEWVEKNVGSDQLTAMRVGGYSNFITDSKTAEAITEVNPAYNRVAYQTLQTNDYSSVIYMNELDNVKIDPNDYLKKNKPDFVVDLYYDPAYKLAPDWLFGEYEVVKVIIPVGSKPVQKLSYLVENMFDPYPWELLWKIDRPGPYVLIYKKS